MLSDGWLRFAPASLREERLPRRTGVISSRSALRTASAETQQPRNHRDALCRLGPSQHKNVIIRVESQQ
jgi:hypothetical protein